MNSIIPRLLAAGLLLPLISSRSFSGEFFTDEEAFQAAVADLFPAGSEDFDSYPFGPVTDPALFMDGQIEIGGAFPFINRNNSEAVPSTPNEWLGGEGSAVTIHGPDGGSLGFSAFSLRNRREFDGTWTFTTSTGVDTMFQAETPFPDNWYSHPGGFLGWVGTADEVLVSITHDTGRVAFDDLAAYSLSAPSIDAAIEQLIVATADVNLARGIANSLDGKLDNALDAYLAEKNSIVNKLQAYINEVEAQRDKAITNADADLLSGMASDLIELIEAAPE